MAIYLLDGKDMTSREEAFSLISKELELPEYFGKNLDALYDCLTEKSSDHTVVFVNTAILEEYLGEYGQKILNVFRDAAAECGFEFKEKR